MSVRASGGRRLAEFGDRGRGIREKATVVYKVASQEVTNLGARGSLRGGSVGIHGRNNERAWSHISYHVERRRAGGVCARLP